jgi:hypothetical protein
VREAPSKSPPKGETLRKKYFKALSFGEGWVRLLAMTWFQVYGQIPKF